MSDFVNIKSEENGNDIELKSDLVYYNENFRFNNIMNGPEYKKFVKAVEKTVRKSKEYDKYLCMLKERYPILNYDNVFKNINSADAEIEMHHYPFTLFDICDIVSSYNIWLGKPKTSFMTAKEILELHFRNKIGLVPVCKTAHELSHDGKLFISERQIFGDWQWFADNYKDVLTPEMNLKLHQLKMYTNDNIATDYLGVLEIPEQESDDDE